MKNYIVGFHNGYEMEVELFETTSLKAAKKWATRNRYYNCGRLTVPCIYTRLLDGRVELAAVGWYNRCTRRTKWTDVNDYE
jgi:hypothetical protein|nr:MAG TPA: hypothetical protein [Caudoviricetes sp.]